MATPNPLELLFMNSDRADVIFVVHGEEIPGHRVILSAVCPYFDTLLYGHFKESKSKHVEIQETSPNVFKELIRFIYKGQLEVLGWTIDELLALMALAHRYEFQLLFDKVVQLLQNLPLDLDSWTLVNDAATLYDSTALKEKCTSFAESNIIDFLLKNDLDKYTGQMICSMFESLQVSTLNQDQLLSALFEWNKGQKWAEIMPVFQKICWKRVSPDILAYIVKEVFSNLKNVNDFQFLTKCASLLMEPKIGQACDSALRVASVSRVEIVLRVDSVVLIRGGPLTLALPLNIGLLSISLNNYRDNSTDYVKILFTKDGSVLDLPIRRIQFESPNKFNIESIYSPHRETGTAHMTVCQPTCINANVCRYKYSATFSNTMKVNRLLICSRDFENMSQVLLRNLLIL